MVKFNCKVIVLDVAKEKEEEEEEEGGRRSRVEKEV